MIYPVYIQECYINVHTDDNCYPNNGDRYDNKCDIWSNCKLPPGKTCDLIVDKHNNITCKELKCLKALDVGEPCNANTDKCLPGLYCKDATCRYFKSRLLGSSCVNDTECVGETTVCLDGICQNVNNRCNVSMDCQYGQFCSNYTAEAMGTCKSRISEGPCSEQDECQYPKVCGFGDNLDKVCVDRYSKGINKHCLNLFECSPEYYCQNGTCQTLVLSTKQCKSSCDCEVNEQCGFDLTRDKTVCWTKSQILQRKICVQCNKELMKCAEKNMCVYEDDLEITMNDCLYQYCLDAYKKYTDQCIPYSGGRSITGYSNNLFIATIIALIIYLII
ncbi:paramecium surface antigen repeat-containing protein [Heterostelium album PN500]|uniref:Paramecium surface antigen repeat-containing protein n=1 Tax=Heterostelium pallidum (strain ATCC 26659 / Pp 5 / PN500) TaxID=670386 RepID=D3BRD4_HETP5|nr:paramecium surface antigen repeat-containing protein [Heterostelium album PN500]EFA75966.1 paramecium surface antigen repeat-containing protein [Heterostelium album PN500]|eukprot:XP_020428100.1 paramecium surface antigen repeat-containing protein [Heterostelium album PN500]